MNKESVVEKVLKWTFPPNPQGGTPEEELGNNDSNVLYFRSVPPWGLGGKRPFYNKLLKKKTTNK